LPKPKPPFDVGTLVVTKNDLTYLGRSTFYTAGNSSGGTHEHYQYPAGSVLMIVDATNTPKRGWKYKFMTSDRCVLDSYLAHFKTCKSCLIPFI
jgi:hypothetical protein